MCSRGALLWICLFCYVNAKPIDASLLDWFWASNNDVVRNGQPSANSHLLRIPYESKTDDDKFLEEALKFTDVMKSSDLDVCQHNVVLKIKTSCAGMTEEELAKLSVNLLNCQSSVDGRKVFPCREDMSLKECTVNMDANTWNAYHMMNNRARAVCLAARRAQFQALSEMTVNKLLVTSQDQISRMAAIQQGQEELGALTAETMGTVREGNVQLLLHQKALQDSQKTLQNHVSYNMKELLREKALIAAGHRELSDLTRNLREKLDEANKELVLQSLERAGNHQQILSDIETIQKQAEAIYKRIDESTTKLLAHQRIVSEQYEETLQNLVKINATIDYLTKLFTSSHKQLEENIVWIKAYMGESGEELNRITAVVLHIAYLLMGMLLASFLSLPLLSRVALAITVPLNLLLIFDNKKELTMDFSQMTLLLISTTVGNICFNYVMSYVAPLPEPKYYITADRATSNGNVRPTPQVNFFQRTYLKLRNICSGSLAWCGSIRRDEVDAARSYTHNNFSPISSTGREPQDTIATSSPVDTPTRKEEMTHRMVSRWLDNAGYRAESPASSSARSTSSRNTCTARCRNGRKCKNPITPGRDHCRLHVTE